MSQKSLMESVLGIHGRSVNPAADLDQAYAVLTKSDNPRPRILLQLPSDNQEMVEVKRALRIVAEAVGSREIVSSNSLYDWPVYTQLMKQGIKGDGSANALMIGSFTPLSSLAFTHLALDEYGADKPIIIDPVAGRSKTLHGLFIQDSGLNMRFESESIDFVHTNQLTHMLENPDAPTDILEAPTHEENIEQLISEICRVLKPGGQILMLEAIKDLCIYWEPEDIITQTAHLKAFVVNALKSHGLSRIHTEEPALQEGTDYLFDPERNFKTPRKFDETWPAKSFALYARKPEKLGE